MSLSIIDGSGRRILLLNSEPDVDNKHPTKHPGLQPGASNQTPGRTADQSGTTPPIDEAINSNTSASHAFHRSTHMSVRDIITTHSHSTVSSNDHNEPPRSTGGRSSYASSEASVFFPDTSSMSPATPATPLSMAHGNDCSHPPTQSPQAPIFQVPSTYAHCDIPSLPPATPTPHASRRAMPEKSRSSTKGSRSAETEKTKSLKKRYPCKCLHSHNCLETFGTSGHASRHSRMHFPDCRVPCEFLGCTKTFTRKDNMRTHYRSVHGKPPPRWASQAESWTVLQTRSPPAATSTATAARAAAAAAAAPTAQNEAPLTGYQSAVGILFEAAFHQTSCQDVQFCSC